MHPEDRVLVGVINRKKDFTIAREQGWYRIPEGKAPKGIDSHYIAFFFSRAFGNQNGGIHYFARATGIELATRAQLLPDEAEHKRALQRYHVIKFGALRAKAPPILNNDGRRFAFIYTTWDRFIHAKTLSDLYSEADHLVDRIFYTLKEAGYHPQRRWEAEAGYPGQGAQVRILCENGDVVASSLGDEGIPLQDDLELTLAQIKREIIAKGGPALLNIPVE